MIRHGSTKDFYVDGTDSETKDVME